ncbi:MAG: hypothetical protein IKK49_00840 [Clostridia bacterium]|nr:hypothetical protein [Clostridia bacterium]
MKNEPLYILTYEHGGYVLWKDRVKPRIKSLFEWMEKYPRLRIGLDYESFTFDEFSREDPEVVEMICDLLKKYPDRVGLGATTYGQPLSLTISEESNARQLLYAVRTNMEYCGKTPRVYAISEFALNNQTPQLAKLCGYEAAILRSHVMGYGYPKTFDSAWGKWIGKDKTEIPAVPTYDGQGRGYNCTTVDNWILSRWPVDSVLYSLDDFKEMFSKYSPLLATRYDDLTQPIETLHAEIEHREDYEYILLEDIPKIYGEPVDELVTTDNDFHVQMPWGYCGNEIFNGCRAGEVAAVQGEKINALSVVLGGKSEQEKSEEAWKYTLAAQHHDVTICGLLDLSRRFIPSSLSASDYVKAQSISALSSRFADKDNDTLFVFNGHSFAVDEWVEVECKEALTAFDGETQLETEFTAGKLRVHIILPALTAKSFKLVKKESDTKPCCCWNSDAGELVTPVYKLKVNEKGIVWLKNNFDNSFVIDNGEGELFTAWIENEPCASCGEWNVEVTAQGANAVYSGLIGTVPFSFEMRFSGESERIDCKACFEMHGERIGRTDITQGRPVPLTRNGHHHEDKLCFVMNTCLDSGRRMVRDLPYSISDWNGAVLKTEKYWYPNDDILVDTEVSAEESFACSTNMHGIYWLALRDEKQGVAVANRGCMGSAVEGNRLYIPLVYSNEYMCGTRILDGVFEDEFALIPFSAEKSDAELHCDAVSYVYPPVSAVIAKGSGDMSSFTLAGFEGDSEVIITALYPEDDHILVRFCNYSDSASFAVLTPSVGKVKCETDLLGNELDKTENGKLSFRPWEIKTVKITL